MHSLCSTDNGQESLMNLAAGEDNQVRMRDLVTQVGGRIIESGPYKGVSPLFFLCLELQEEGQALLAQLCGGENNQAWLRNLLIESGGKLIPSGEMEGLSPLFFLCAAEQGQELLGQLCGGENNQAWLRDLLIKVGGEFIPSGEMKGTSLLSELCATEKGQELLGQLCGGEDNQAWLHELAKKTPNVALPENLKFPVKQVAEISDGSALQLPSTISQEELHGELNAYSSGSQSWSLWHPEIDNLRSLKGSSVTKGEIESAITSAQSEIGSKKNRIDIFQDPGSHLEDNSGSGKVIRRLGMFFNSQPTSRNVSEFGGINIPSLPGGTKRGG